MAGILIPSHRLITPPAAEPVTVAEAKARLRLTVTSQDAMIGAMITAARLHVEQLTGRALIDQTWEMYLDCFPAGSILLPRGPVQEVTEFEWITSADVTNTWTVSGDDLLDGSTVKAHIDTARDPAEIRLAYGEYWPTDVLKTSRPIRIQYEAGYGAAGSDVPGPILDAILLLVGHRYRNPEATATESLKEIPLGVSSLLANYMLSYA